MVGDTVEGGDAMVAHIAEYHAFTTDELRPIVDEHNEVVSLLPEIQETVEKIIVVLDGKPEHDLHGHEIARHGGMRGKQELIERDVAALKFDSNGGKGFSIRNRDKLIIGAIASIPAIASLIIAAIAVTQNVSP